MEIKFVPAGCSESKDENGEVVSATLSGHIMVEALSYPERMQKKAEFAKLQSGVDNETLATNRMLAIAQMAIELKPRVKSVDLKDLKTGREAKDVEHLYDDPAFDNVMSELTVAFVMGLRPN